MGRYADHPGFFATRPRHYEETVETVRKFVFTVKKQRDEGKLAPDTSALIVVDSIRKLVPEGLLKKLFGEVKGEIKGLDGMNGRGAQIKAAMNAQWLDELIPLLEETSTAIAIIARETDDPDASSRDKMAGRGYKVGGGKALYYDSSMVVRVERAGFISDGGDEEGKNAKLFGERHLATIRKSKVGGREEFTTRAYFHTSNGNHIPVGFDRARDVAELAIRFEVIEKAGAWYSHGEQRLGQGINNVVKNLTENEALLNDIEAATRAAFAMHEPDEVNEETGEVS
jgi:recombination protein RecA